MSCYNHPNASSVNTCSNCGKDICAACVTDFNEKVVCRDCAEKLRKEAPLAPPVEETSEAPAQAVPSKETMPAPVPESTPTTITAPASLPPEAPKSPEAGKSPEHAPASAPAEKKEPILSLLMSVIIPGLGQIYNKQIQKGIILLVGYILLWLVVFVLSYRSNWCCCLTFWVPLIVMLYAAYDAYTTTKKINDGQTAKDWLS
jgi:TM2 domain-containing membrane protein YozV